MTSTKYRLRQHQLRTVWPIHPVIRTRQRRPKRHESWRLEVFPVEPTIVWSKEGRSNRINRARLGWSKAPVYREWYVSALRLAIVEKLVSAVATGDYVLRIEHPLCINDDRTETGGDPRSPSPICIADPLDSAQTLP